MIHEQKRDGSAAEITDGSVTETTDGSVVETASDGSV